MRLKRPKRGAKYSDRIVNKNVTKAYIKTDFTYLFCTYKLFSSKLISRFFKLQLYNTLIQPTVIYAYETWVLKENMTNNLMIF